MSKPATSVFQMARAPMRHRDVIDTELIRVEHNTPIPTRRQVPSKYDHLFAKMREGSCIACEIGESAAIRGALSKWIVNTGKADKLAVRLVSKCADGKARVWLTRK